MRVGIDATALLPRRTGVDNYILGLLRGLAQLRHDHTIVAFANLEEARGLQKELGPNVDVRAVSLRPRPARLALQQGLLPLVARSGLDVVHSPAFIMPLARGGRPHVLTVHDMTSFTMPWTHTRLRRSRAYRAAVLASIRRADLVLVPSQQVRDDVRRIVPGIGESDIAVVPWGVCEDFAPQSPDRVAQVRARLGLPESYLLHVGMLQPRKNLTTLIDAYQRLVNRNGLREDLVLAGPPGWGVEATRDWLDNRPVGTRVHTPGYVPREDLPALYAGASLLVFPSVDEGFGFPPLEAMACGTPVVASQTPALTENLNGAARLVPAHDVDGLAASMHDLLAEGSERERLRAAGLARAARFRWEDTARATLERYEQLTRQRRPAERARFAT